MLFGAGLTAGLLGQIGEALNSRHARQRRADRVVGAAVRGALPVRAQPRSPPTRSASRRFAIDLGPFGGAQTFGAVLWPYAIVYLARVGAGALWAFRRRDL